MVRSGEVLTLVKLLSVTAVIFVMLMILGGRETGLPIWKNS